MPRQYLSIYSSKTSWAAALAICFSLACSPSSDDPSADDAQLSAHANAGLDAVPDGPNTDEMMRVSDCLAARYGEAARPRNWLFALDAKGDVENGEVSPAESAFLLAIKKLRTWKNEQEIMDVTPLQLAVNMLAEGGIVELTKRPTLVSVHNINPPADGNSFVAWTGATDRLMYRGWLRDDDLTRFADLNADFSLEDVVRFGAAALAYARDLFYAAVENINDVVPKNITLAQKMYWTTMFYNTSPGVARAILREHCKRGNCDLEPRIYKGARDLTNPRYNAAMRTSIYQFSRAFQSGFAESSRPDDICRR